MAKEKLTKQYRSVIDSTLITSIGNIRAGEVFTANEADVKELLEKKYIVEIKTREL